MFNISPKRQLWLLFGFYCFSNALGSFVVLTVQKFSSHQVAKLALSTIPIFSFLVPAFIAYKLFANKSLFNYWGLSIPFRKKSFFITVSIMGCCIILMNWLLQVNKSIPLFQWMKADETETQARLMQYLEMDNSWQLLLNLVIFSVVPSFCEEVFFRGTMQSIFCRYLPKVWLAIFLTAFVFSLLHFQFAGFLPRLLAGVVLGGIFCITGSLWLSMVSHTLYNGFLIILNYANQHNQVDMVHLERQLLHPFLVVLAAALILLLFCQLRKESFKTRKLYSQ